MLEILLDEFMFGSLWNGGIFLFVAFAAIIYLFLLPHDDRHSIWKTLSFSLGLIAVFASIGSPLNIIGRIQFSTHIIQVVLLLFVAPPLLVYGFKQKSIDLVKDKLPVVKRFINFVTKPLFAIILFYGLVYVYHISFVFDFARMDLFLNYFYLLALFVAAILFWVPIISTNYSYKQRLIYTSSNILLLIPLSLIWLLVDKSLYTTYTDMTSFIAAMELCLPAGETLPTEYYSMLLPFDPVAEQVKGGLILLVAQLAIFSIALLLLNFTKKK
ncbi:cytochrome c oxidase assembly protein [Ornithinibacillus halophilus]|uniref:Putative membrane protein n=1 Tax=Ornithinibacillus halophilus TaxID=930117 RepID=A0A1M5M014_9BACI|nr:cytochrome c oxidase assembly protein [Ornithinibacillus halophilus]SHG70269.1 putative membrane protein [Ornithinibacillus halophilus]